MKNIFIFIFISIFYLPIAQSEPNEKLTVLIPQKIGIKQVLTVKVSLTELEKTRDLHVSVQKFPDFNRVAKTMKRISKNGNYHFDLPIKDNVPGRYRLVTYLTPKGKDWNSRLVQIPHQNFEIIDDEIYEKKPIFDQVDEVKFVRFPNIISGKEEAELLISYSITQARSLHIRLANSKTWQDMGTLRFPVSESGELSIPLANMTDDFTPGKYAWIINLVDNNSDQPVSKNYGKHFELVE
jgi:hypothetical protein